VSKLIETLRSDLAKLHAAGAINKVTKREFDTICPTLVSIEGREELSWKNKANSPIKTNED